MLNAKRYSWAVFQGEVCHGGFAQRADAEACAKIHGGAVVEVTLVPTADLERLLKAAGRAWDAMDSVHGYDFVTSEDYEPAFDELQLALAPFTGDADAK